MSRIIYYAAASLNGFLADEASSLDWLFAVERPIPDPEDAFMRDAGVVVEGSNTCEWVLRYERLLDEPERWGELYGDRPTFVFTTRDLPIPQGADVRFVSGSVAAHLPEVIEAAGDRNVWVAGGGDLAGQFLDAGALNEIQISVAPVALTGGAPVLPRRLESDVLRLRSVKQVGQFAHLVFDVTPPHSAGASSNGG